MANYWVISIGINQYRHLQPLAHAQNDALYIHRFFTEEAGIPSDHCVLLSDLSSSVGQQIVYPDKPMISEWVQTVTHKVQKDDVLWFFFSGYGAQVESEDGKKVDYLMPIDGDPGQIEGTGIALSDLIDTLAGLPTDKTLLVLDINRSQGTLSGQSIGAQTIDLAASRKVSTLLSCQPEQYSHGNIFGIRPGLFTATLLEAMRQDCQAVEPLSSYLAQRLPELCKHHLRPIQNPVSVVADDRKLLQVVPDNSSLTTVATEMTDTTEMTGKDTVTDLEKSKDVGEKSDGRDRTAAKAGAVAATGVAAATAGSVAAAPKATSAKTNPAKSLAQEKSKGASVKPPYTEETISTGSYRSQEGLSSRRKANRKAQEDLSAAPNKDDANADTESMAISGAKLRNWGLLTLAILMGGVLLKQPFVGAAWNKLTDRQPAAESTTETTAETATDGTAVDDTADTDVSTAEAGAPSAETAPAEAASTETPGAEAAAATPDNPQAAAQSNSAETTSAEATGETTDTAEKSAENSTAESVEDTAAAKAAAKNLMTQANKAIDQGQYTEALIALKQIPKSQRQDGKFAQMLTKAKAGAEKANQTNDSVLTEARLSIQPTQASQFSEAIAKARQIQPGEARYEDAQQDIAGWSQVILDIAEGRATSGNLEGAIAAAKVMPYDNAEYHQKAQESIAFWQQRQQSRSVIAEAQKIPKLGQANTYQKGIVKLREVPIEHAEYEAAQRLADQWSESIFSIAQARAAQGREEAAIQAAVLVPAGTVAYEPTQQAIRRWRAKG